MLNNAKFAWFQNRSRFFVGLTALVGAAKLISIGP
jgi:hypothetical protein